VSDSHPSPLDEVLAVHDDADDLHEVSRALQRGMIPADAPRVEGFDLAAGTTLEHTGRGNTTWDHVRLRDGRIAILVMDVRADGLPPAHIAGMARAALRTAAAASDDPAELLRLANGALADMHVEGVDQFVECGVLVPEERGIVWASGGRMPAGILGRDGTFRQLGSHGPPLGMMDGFGYGTERAEMGSGDTVLVLSGGSVGLFRGAADLVAQVHGKPAGEIVATVHRAIRKAQEAEEKIEEISAVYLRKH
jgi:serine phosphatase RsbU (regulator of sigma subunit)